MYQRNSQYTQLMPTLCQQLFEMGGVGTIVIISPIREFMFVDKM